MAIDQNVAHREILSKTNHGIVNRLVTMGMVFTQYVTDAGCGLFERLVGSQAAFQHGVQDAAVNRLQAVTNVRKRTADDDAHGVFDIGLLHFVDQIALGNMLVGEENIFGFITAIMCQNTYLLNRIFAALPLNLPPGGRWLAEGETEEERRHLIITELFGSSLPYQLLHILLETFQEHPN